jgi:hypothetical protein
MPLGSAKASSTPIGLYRLIGLYCLRVGRHPYYPGKTGVDTDLGERSTEEVAQCPRSELLNVFGVVAQVSDILSSAEVPDPEERLPGHGHHAAAMADAPEFLDGAFGCTQVLEHLEAGDHLGAVIEEGKHAGVGPDTDSRRKTFEGHCQLVVSVFDSDQ